MRISCLTGRGDSPRVPLRKDNARDDGDMSRTILLTRACPRTSCASINSSFHVEDITQQRSRCGG